MSEETEGTEEFKLNYEHLVSAIASLSASQRFLSQSALDLQALALAKKRQIKAAINNAAEVGEILTGLIQLLEQKIDELNEE